MKLFRGDETRHKHEWEIVYEATVPSFSERYGAPTGLPNIGTWMYERKFVTVMRCKCGKTRKTIKASG